MCDATRWWCGPASVISNGSHLIIMLLIEVCHLLLLVENYVTQIRNECRRCKWMRWRWKSFRRLSDSILPASMQAFSTTHASHTCLEWLHANAAIHTFVNRCRRRTINECVVVERSLSPLNSRTIRNRLFVKRQAMSSPLRWWWMKCIYSIDCRLILHLFFPFRSRSLHSKTH